MVSKLAAAIYNDIMSGLAGITSTPTISMDQLEDDIVDERLQIIKEYSLKHLVPKKDLLMGVHCIPVDCKSLDKCPTCLPNSGENYSDPVSHFQIPQIANDLMEDSVEFAGSVDRLVQFKVYTSTSWQYHQYLRRGADKPFIYIETTPNNGNFYDVWVYNAPLLKVVSMLAIWKDPRQLMEFDCCKDDTIDNYTFLSAEIKKRLTEKKIRYYRNLHLNPSPNTQSPK